MRALLLAGFSLMLSSNTWAEPSSKIAWTPQTLNFVKGGNSGHGKVVASTCVGCHNPSGDYPSLDGQLPTYLYRQMQDYKNGNRQDALMGGIASTLSDQDMADLAAWFGQQKPMRGKGGAQDLSAIASLGDARRMEPPCSSCHGASGQGEKVDTPRLAGQKPAYLEKTLLAYRSGDRANDIFSRMRLIAGKLSDREIKQLADYYGKLD